MSIKHNIYLLMAIMAVLSGCTASGYSSSSSSQGVAQISAFALDHDSFPALAKAVFRVYERGDNAVGDIINPDSMPVGTPLTKVHPTYVFYATPSEAKIVISHFRDTAVTRIKPDSVFTKSLTSRDTLNMDADSIHVTIVSADGKRTKVYRIQPLVHTSDPDAYVWTKKRDAVYPMHDNDIQHLIKVDERLMLFASDGVSDVRLYTCSTEDALAGKAWTAKTVSGLPKDCRVRQIIWDEGHRRYYYGQNRNLYTSTDGQTWTASPVDRDMMATMFSFGIDTEGTVRPWFITRDDHNDFALGYWSGDEIIDFLPLQRDSMPVSGFTVVHFETASGRSRLVVLGGMTDDGVMLRKRWSLENSPLVGTRLSDYSAEPMSFPVMVNAAAVSYGDRLLLFGAQDANYQYIGRDVYESTDEGLRWAAIDSTKCQMPAAFAQRKNICAVESDNRIIVIGGSDNMTTYGDLYVGYKNAVVWEK